MELCCLARPPYVPPTEPLLAPANIGSARQKHDKPNRSSLQNILNQHDLRACLRSFTAEQSFIVVCETAEQTRRLSQQL